MRLVSMKLDNPYTGYMESVDAVSSLCDVEVVCNQDLWNLVDGRHLSRVFLDRLSSQTSPSKLYPRWSVSSLYLIQVHDFATSHAAILCSALPHLKSITRVNLPMYPQMKDTPVSIASEWAWLGYTIFHPEAASHSGFNIFNLELTAVLPADVGALQSMAVGNNLLGGNVSGYPEGRVLPSTNVMIRPQDDDEVLYTFVSETWVGLCVPAVHALEYQNWICVVVPGYGSGWIRRSDIIEVRCRPAGKSCIRTLCISILATTVPEELLTPFLAVLGSEVTTLYLQSFRAVSTETVQAMMRLCASLTSLRLRHDGSSWANEMLAMERPRLEQLELTIDRTSWQMTQFQELKPACLPNLRALRVIANSEYSFEYHEEIVAAFLGEHPLLEYLHWSCGRDMQPQRLDSPIAERNTATKKLVSRFLRITSSAKDDFDWDVVLLLSAS